MSQPEVESGSLRLLIGTTSSCGDSFPPPEKNFPTPSHSCQECAQLQPLMLDRDAPETELSGEAGVDAGTKAVAFGGAAQEIEEDGTILGSQRGQEFGVELGDPLLGFDQEGMGGGQEMKGVGTAVARVATTLHEVAFLQVVHQADHHIAMDLQRLAELLLSAAVMGTQEFQHAEVARLDAERRQQITEAVGGMEAQLAEEKSGVGRQLRRVGHTPTIRRLTHHS